YQKDVTPFRANLPAFPKTVAIVPDNPHAIEVDRIYLKLKDERILLYTIDNQKTEHPSRSLSPEEADRLKNFIKKEVELEIAETAPKEISRYNHEEVVGINGKSTKSIELIDRITDFCGCFKKKPLSKKEWLSCWKEDSKDPLQQPLLENEKPVGIM